MRILLLFIFVLLSFHVASAQVDPAIHWKVLEEEHAVWIYDSRHKALVNQYSKIFRRVFPRLQELFQEVPKKTTFVISDFTDLPNGSATVFPYPLVTIYPVIPIPNSQIGETDDSFYEIVVHEYTHILNLYPVHGIPRGLSWLFGSIVRPNAYLPRWYAEGLATFAETYYTQKGGRLRSQNFEGVMRAMGQAKTWSEFELDQLNDFQPDWWGGRRAYLLGGALMHEIASQHGIEKIYELNQRYSRRLPYLINTPIEDISGLEYPELLDKVYLDLQTRVDEQLRTIATAPVTEGAPLAHQGFHNSRPMFSPNGEWLAYLTRDDDVPSAIHLVQRTENLALKDQKPQQIAFRSEINHLAWSSDSQVLAYNAVESHRRYYFLSDIYLYNITSKKTDRLTRGARAGDMVFSPDNKDIIFVQNTAGSKRISRVSLTSKTIKPIYTPERLGTNLYGLILEDQKVLFIEHVADKRALKALDLASNSAETLVEGITVSQLRKTPHGVLVTSSHSGVDNLYLAPQLDKTFNLKSLKPMTNSLTRVYDGDLDPKDKSLYYSEQRDNSVAIYTQAEDKWNQITQAPAVKPLMMQKSAPDKPETTPSNEPSWTAEKNFSPLPYLWPRYWMPFGYVLDGGMGFQASTGAMDPLGKNAYNLMLEWDTLTKKTGVAFDYVNNSLPFEIVADASQVYRYFYTTETTVQDRGYGLGGNFRIPFVWKSWMAGVGFRQSESDMVTTQYRRAGPYAHLSYNSAIRRGYQISPRSGTGFSLMHQSYLEGLGNLSYHKTNLSFRQFAPSFFDRHAIMLQVNGTYAPDLNNPLFFTGTIGGNYFTNQLIQPFLVRGYPSGTILGNNVGAVTLEYRFPIANVYEGWGTLPFFVKQIKGAFVGDSISLDGLRYDVVGQGYARTRFGDDWFTWYGAEIDIETTMGYYLPVTISFGVYRGDVRRVTDDELSYFFNFQF